MAQLIALAIAAYFFSKLFGSASKAGSAPEGSSTSFEQDLDDFIAMDIVSDGDLDGDFE
jgi:hypothetical protein